MRFPPPPRSAEDFGGLNIVLCGDFFQLPPVRKKLMFDNGVFLRLADLYGRSVYRKFNITIELDIVVRQQGDDRLAVQFTRLYI